jgi:hypothetical protein
MQNRWPALLLTLPIFLLLFGIRPTSACPIGGRPDGELLAKGNSPTGKPNQPSGSFLFGVINNNGVHYADEWQHGVRATTFEFQWQLYEPQPGVFDQAYIDHMKSVLSGLKAQGWAVQMIPGTQYVPQWVYDNYPDMAYVNQYGELFTPDPLAQSDYRSINAPFNPQARELIASYLKRIFQDFDQSNPLLHFDAVRIGGGMQGELRYPPASWMGHTNSFWAFDRNAQDPAISGIPASVVGWRPGIDANPASNPQGQLLVNPGFEENQTNYPTFGWTPDDQVSAVFTHSDPQEGSQALQLTLKDGHRIHQYVRVLPGTTYAFGAWMKSGQAGGSARLFVSEYSADNQPVANTAFAKLETGATSWSMLSGELTTSPATVFLKVELDGSQPGVYFFDHLWLNQPGATNQAGRDISIPRLFYDWYVQKLSDYQNWQIAQMRQYYDGPLDVLYAGKGLRAGQVMDALDNDLRGDGWSESNQALYAGTVYARHVKSLETTQGIRLFLTGVEDPPENLVDDASPYPNDWSAARWITSLARSRSLPVWGENSGKNNPEQMKLSMQRMWDNDFLGLMWGFESELYANPNPNAYATIADYDAEMHSFNQRFERYLPICEK